MSRPPLRLVVAGLACAAAACAAADGEPHLPLDHPVVLAIGPVELVGTGIGSVAARIATEEELPHKLVAAAGTDVVVVPHAWLLRAAASRVGCPAPTQWATAREAAKLLSYDRLALVRVTSHDGPLICEWQIYDAAGDAGTLAAGRLPGHIDDLDGLMASLARRVGDAVGAFERARLTTAARAAVSGSGDAFGDYYYGRAALELGDLKEADLRFARAASVDPGLAEARLFLGAVSACRARDGARRRDWPAALQDAAAGLHALQGLPPSVYACELLGVRAECLAQLEPPDDATGAVAEQALALMDAGMPDRAIALLATGGAGPPDADQVRLLRARALRALGKWAEAEAELLALAKSTCAAEARSELPWVYEEWADSMPATDLSATNDRRKRYALARAALDGVPDDAWEWHRTRLLVGLISLGLGDAGRAAEELGRAARPTEDRPATLPATDEVLCLAALAEARVQRGDKPGARAALDEAVSVAAAVRADRLLEHSVVRPAPYRGLMRMVRVWLGLGEPVFARRCLLEIRLEFGNSSELDELSARSQSA